MRQMKKRIAIFITSLIILVCSAVALCSCDMFNAKTNADAGREDMNRFINCLNSKNSDGMKSLFSVNHTARIVGFDEDISELFELYKGEFISHNFFEPSMVEDDVHNGVQKKWFVISADITTTEDVFHVAMYWCDMDTSDSGNVGIWSLYIFRVEDNPLSDYSFYGDEPWESEKQAGIHVVKPYKYIEMTVNIFQSKDSDAVKTLFAPSVISGNSALNNSIQNLFSYYSTEFTSYTQVASDETVKTDADGMVTERYKMSSYKLDTADGTFLLAVKYCDKSVGSSDAVGMYSVYICKSNPTDEPYWGDGLWTEGINIDTE